jgi:hypothetical protein
MNKDLGVAAVAAPLTSKRDQLLQLADRCEREEPSRALDAAIENVLTGGSPADLSYILADVETTTRPPAYTTSLDAAVTLVRKRWGHVLRDIPGIMPTATVVSGFLGDSIDATARTLPLALCAAALRARAAESPADERERRGSPASEQGA